MRPTTSSVAKSASSPLTTPSVKVMVIPTNEELVIAQDTAAIVKG